MYISQTITHTHEIDENEPETVNKEVKAEIDMEFDLYLLQHFNDFECITQLESVSTTLAAQCLQFKNKAGKTFFVKKSTLCWLLNNPKTASGRILSDRIRRFIVENSKSKSLSKVHDEEHLKIGDWAEFTGKYSVGQVIGFSYLTGSKKEREYTLDSAPLTIVKSGSSFRGIGVLCNWFTIKPGFVLESAPMDKHEYVNIIQFKAHLYKPMIEEATLKLILDERNHVSE